MAGDEKAVEVLAGQFDFWGTPSVESSRRRGSLALNALETAGFALILASDLATLRAERDAAVTAEREACAVLANAYEGTCDPTHLTHRQAYECGSDDASMFIAEAIRARAALPAAPATGREAEAEWTLADLRSANVRRQAEWCPGQQPDLSFRGNELAGEVGEACNVIKKLERERQGWAGSRATSEHLAEELADVVICADLAALAAGVDLYGAVRDKFNATTRKVGLTTFLAPPASAPDTGGGR